MKEALENSGQKELQKVSSPTSFTEQGQLQSIAQGLLQLIFQNPPNGRSHHPSGQPAPASDHSPGNFFPRSSQHSPANV